MGVITLYVDPGMWIFQLALTRSEVRFANSRLRSHETEPVLSTDSLNRICQFVAFVTYSSV